MLQEQKQWGREMPNAIRSTKTEVETIGEMQKKEKVIREANMILIWSINFSM